MKNIYKTILVWLLTAIIGSIIFGFMLNASEAKHTGRFSLDTGEVAIVSAIAAVVSLGLSLPATIIFHFLAVRLYERWESITSIKITLAFYVVGVTFLSIFIVGWMSAESMNSDFFLLAVPYSIGALISSLLFSYRPALKEQKWGDDSIMFPTSGETEEAYFPKETHAIIICITVLMSLWAGYNLFKYRFYGGGFNIGFSILSLAALVAGLILFARKNVKGWYLLFGYFVYGSVSTLLSALNLLSHYRNTISSRYISQTFLVLIVCNLAPLLLIAAPKMVRYFRVQKSTAILVGIVAALFVAVIWAKFWMR